MPKYQYKYKGEVKEVEADNEYEANRLLNDDVIGTQLDIGWMGWLIAILSGIVLIILIVGVFFICKYLMIHLNGCSSVYNCWQ